MESTTSTELHPVSRDTIEQLKLTDLHPVPPEWTPRVPHPPEGKRAHFVRDDVVESGNATDWDITNDEGRLEWRLETIIPCSYDWCRGHEEFYEWDELTHISVDEKLPDTTKLSGEVCVVAKRGDAPRLNVYLDIHHDVALDDVDALIEALETFGRLLRVQTRRAVELGSAVA